jgi:class 3 adenylate cyclase
MLVFYFTDIEGSTRLWEEPTSEMGQVIARHDAILRQQVEDAGGRITKHTGDVLLTLHTRLSTHHWHARRPMANTWL